MHDKNDKVIFMFWIYLMTDLIMFAVLFAVYAVLRGNTFGGPSERELLSLPGALAETLILLTSSFTCGLAMIAAYSGRVRQTLAWLAVTFALGVSFLTIEMNEFAHLMSEGHDWTKSASLSSFFALVGTHGLHISIGLLWIIIAITMVWSRGLTPFITSKLTRFSLFWHFLDVVWIFIFTVVYLMPHA
ncbi:MAG: cytochrome o ubiquinol oxidase subunit III [bacterium]|nr:cytochrome o ubiquinol oxidase subunit III [bacterium]